MSRIDPVVMPKLGLSMTEGMVVGWRVKSGDRVNAGDIVADIETSKITNELEVHKSGVIRGELSPEGVDLPVGELLCVVADDDVSDADIERFIADYRPSETASQDEEAIPATEDVSLTNTERQPDQTEERDMRTAPEAASAAVPESIAGKEDDSDVTATPLARKMAARLGVNLHRLTGTGRGGRISKEDIRRALTAAGVSSDETRAPVTGVDSHIDTEIPATPLARRLARQFNLSLSQISPTGSRGRVTRDDVLREAEYADLSTTTTADRKSDVEESGYDEYPLDSMRRAIAERLSQSKRDAPHYRLTQDINMERLLALRGEINQSTEEGKITITDLLVKAVAYALMQNPGVNIQFDGSRVRRYRNADVAVAVAIDAGLVTPIVRKAEQKSLRDIAAELRDMADRARRGSLQPEEFEGGTFTLSNLGMYGIPSFDAIINPPQAAILAIGATEKRRAFVADEEIIARFMTVNLSSDHRVIDGAVAAAFLQSLKQTIEHPGCMLA